MPKHGGGHQVKFTFLKWHRLATGLLKFDIANTQRHSSCMPVSEHRGCRVNGHHLRIGIGLRQWHRVVANGASNVQDAFG